MLHPWLRSLIGVLLVVGLLPAAHAHPMSRDKYSLRTALRLQDTGGAPELEAVVVLEVPFQVVMGALEEELKAARASDEGRAAAKRVLDGHSEDVWAKMASQLTITVDGKPLEGSWGPQDSRFNGKGAVTEGFFIYIVEFTPTDLTLDEDVTVQVTNRGWTDVPMVYSAMVLDGPPWTAVDHSLEGVLPDKPYDLNDPAFWLEDESLRMVTVRYTR